MSTRIDIYDQDLDKNAANYTALTPLTFIAWTAEVYPERLAVVHGKRRYLWCEVYARSRRLASALAARGIGKGDTVSAMLSNTPEMYEAHFGVPKAGAVLNALNTRLDAGAIAFMLGHAETKVLLTDREFAPTIEAALAKIDRKPLVIDVLDPEYLGPGSALGEIDYEALLASGDPDYAWQPPSDEWNAIALNYTSGTTGNPKGVVYHHRGAYLNALSNAVHWTLPKHAVYLWTLPMFHCNGWCFAWTMAANAGVNICLRKVEAKAVFDLIREHKVTHYCGAPIVHSARAGGGRRNFVEIGIRWPCKKLDPPGHHVYPGYPHRINQFRRDCACLPPLARWTEGEICADMMAEYDSSRPNAHAGFMDNICMGGSAQNECPGWRSNEMIIQGCLQSMWDEGPPPTPMCSGQWFQTYGHFINMTSTRATKVACGFFTTSGGKIWSVQNFSR